MHKFLERVAEEILKKHKQSLGEVLLILPSRRAIVFLKDILSEQLTEASWLPECISFEDFIYKYADYAPAEQIDLQLELYEIHKEIEGKNAESLDDFLNWSNLLLHDFNELDLHLVDANDLYSYLNEVRAIEQWDLGSEGLSTAQSNYLQFWQKLQRYYERYTDRAKKRRISHQGLAYRTLAENIDQCMEQLGVYTSIYFVGFNALTKSEEVIIQHLVKNCDTYTLWDADDYYLNDSMQEAGKFLRQHFEKTDSPKWITQKMSTKEKNIHIYGLEGQVAQVKWITQLLQDLTQDEKDSKQIAIVLADEELLIPLLESIPEKIGSLNVTMGYPLVHTNSFQCIDEYMRLFKPWGDKEENISNNALSSISSKKTIQFFKSFLLDHMNPIQKQALLDHYNELRKYNGQNVKNDSIKKIDKLLEFPLLSLDKPSQVFESSIALLDALNSFTENPIEQAAKEIIIQNLRRLLQRIKKDQLRFSWGVVAKFFKQSLHGVTVPFVGEPLEGIQIMGILESRVLDFDHLIIAGVNEGVLPKSKSNNSFIPFDVKRKFNLPVHTDKDAIFAYHFYRLLQHPRHVSLLYNNSTDGFSSGEKSRFIEQLIHEWPEKNQMLKLRHEQIKSPSLPQSIQPTSIAQSEETLHDLDQLFKRGLSPSTIISFLSKPLDFYFNYLLRLKPIEPIDEMIADNVLGTIVHNALEALYAPFVGHYLTLDSILVARKRIQSVLEDAFVKEMHLIPQYGNQRLVMEVAAMMIEKMLQMDEIQLGSKASIKITSLEKEYATVYKANIEGELKSIKLKGKVDRVEEFNGQLRIIDYKTGLVKPRELRGYNHELLLEGKRNIAFQMLIYQYIVQEMTHSSNVITGVYSLRNNENKLMVLQDNLEINTHELLNDVIQKMLAKEMVFENQADAMYTQWN